MRSEVRRTRARGGRGGGVPEGELDVDAEGCGSEFFMTYEEADVIAVSNRLVVPDIA